MLGELEIEVCINSASVDYVNRAAAAAELGGARRIELCAAMDQDGLTPAIEHIRAARKAFRPEGLMVMVRPRAGNFYYSLEESDVMVRQIEMAARACADGVVLGGLRARDNAIDEGLLLRLLDTARSLKLTTTFHRAFDATLDPEKSLDTLMQLGVDRVLTSGTRWGSGEAAMQGVPLLNRLIAQAGQCIEIVVGGGLSPDNSPELMGQLVRSSGKVSLHAYSGVLHNGEVSSERVRAMSRGTA
ncbi:copper homeostasis protein CutC [Endozoicomonas lisbonensis]|uniref:PF03932 family protein CutC n=1 Tax=Endozoicomonas lisbonensis TaxID=3120522 RepID=A0ABV2SDW6_9GAMM